MASKRPTKQDVIEELTKTNLELQKKCTDLIISMNGLTKNIKTMIKIFTKAAENIERGEVKEPLALKLADLLDQNKKIAKGLLLLEKYVKDRGSFSTDFGKNEF